MATLLSDPMRPAARGGAVPSFPVVPPLRLRSTDAMRARSWLNLERALLERVIAIRPAEADITLTDFATTAARALNASR
jgi:hypothetical protein